MSSYLYYNQAVLLAKQNKARQGEGQWLMGVGLCYYDLGDAHESIEYYKQALAIARKVGDKRGKCASFDNMGFALINTGDYQKAKDVLLQGLQIIDEISDLEGQVHIRWGLAQSYLFRDDLVNARATIKAALQYDVPEHNHNTTALHGIIALRQGERKTAQEAFTKSIAHADEILVKTPDYYSALDAKGLALCGLILCRGGSRSAPTQNQPAQRQPLRIQRGVIIGRLDKDFIRVRNGLGKSLLRGFPFPLPQSDDSVQGGCIVIVFWHIILKRGFDGGSGID